VDTFSLIVFGGLVLFVATLLWIGFFNRSRVRDLTHKGDHRVIAARLAIEERDVPEMVDAQNDYRRRGGRAEITEQEIRRQVGAREIERLDEADAEARRR
jgi:hypothetical protein